MWELMDDAQKKKKKIESKTKNGPNEILQHWKPVNWSTKEIGCMFKIIFSRTMQFMHFQR